MVTEHIRNPFLVAISAAAKRLFLGGAVFLVLTLASHPLWSADFAAPPLSLEDPAYADLDLLASHGLLPDLIHGLRPLSRSRIAQLILSARRRLYAGEIHSPSEKTLVTIQSVLEELESRFSADLARELGNTASIQLEALKSVQWRTSYISAPPRAHFDGGLGLIGATLPLAQYQAGRHIPQGLGHALETEHEFFGGKNFSAYSRLRFQMEILNNQRETETAFFLQEGGVTALFFNTQLEAGRLPLAWGQSDQGGLMFSTQARPLDLIRVGNPRPWKIPALGQLQYLFYFGTLGPEQFFEYPFITGGKIVVKPWRGLEIGISRSLIFGGEGAPQGSFGEIFMEYFGGRSSLTRNVTNALSGFEGRVTIPGLRYTSLYGEFYFDDFNLGHIFRSFVQDAGILIGIHVPRLNDSGTLSMRLEGRKFSPILYKHPTWASGWTLNGNIMGDPLGPDAESLRVSFTHHWPEHNWRLTTNSYLERIDSDIIGSSPSQGRTVLINGTAEWRVRNQIEVDHNFSDWLSVGATLGDEVVKNFRFVSGNSRHDVSLMTRITLRTRQRFTVTRSRP